VGVTKGTRREKAEKKSMWGGNNEKAETTAGLRTKAPKLRKAKGPMQRTKTG